MNNVLRMGKKVFTVSVVVTTIAWSIGLAALLMPLAAGAATLSAGDLIKASLPAVYYYGADGKRYVFPNEKTFKTWFTDFSSVKKITDAELAAIAIGGNATYKPGVKMVKITTDPKVYAVDAGGTLRWVNSEVVAGNLYGTTWNKQIDDVPDAFFTNYKTGSDVAVASEFDKAAIVAAAVSINVDKGLAAGGAAGGTGALTIAADAANFAAASIVVDSDTGATDTDSGQQRAPLLKIKFTAGSAAVKVTALKLKRGGISKDGDVDNVYLMEGKTVLAEAVSTNDAVVNFSATAGLFTVPANGSKVIDAALNLNKATATGSTLNLSLAAADVTSDAASVSGSASGNSMTVAAVSDLGELEIGQTNTAPASVDPGVTNKEMWRTSFNALSQDILLTYAKFTNLGSTLDSDIQNLKLMDGATQLNGVVAQVTNKEVEFDLTTMTGGGYKILAGQNKQLTLNGDVVGGTNRNYKWTIQKQYDVRAKDLEYGVEVFLDDYDATKDNSFGVITQDSSNTDNTTTINVGTLSIGVATESPSTNVPDEGVGVTLAIFNFKASGEDVKVSSMTIQCSGSSTDNALKNTLIKLDGVQVGSTDSSLVCDGSTASNAAAYSFGNSLILTAGKTHKISVTADLNASATAEAWSADQTVYVSIGGTVTSQAQGKLSLTSIDLTAVNGRTLTVKTGAVTVIKDTSFTNRTSSAPTGVANAAGVKIDSFVVIAGSGEAVDMSQIVLYDNATYFMGGAFQNMVLKNREGTQIGTTIASLNSSAAGSYTFTPATSIRIEAGAQMAFDVFADVKGTITAGYSSAARDILEVDTVSATGVITGASANYGTSGATSNVTLQQVYLVLHGNLTVDEAADSPIAQQIVLGATGIELAKFKLSADAAEDITLTTFIIEDDMSTGVRSMESPNFITGRSATGTLKNFKLYNGTVLLASVASLDDTYNTHASNATFTGFSLSVPKNQNVTLTVKADVSSYSDGGVPSSTHRMIVPIDYKTSVGGASAAQEPITAVGAGSGIGMSLDALDLAGGSAAFSADGQVTSNYMDAVRAKLTIAFAADSPSGSSTKSSEQTVAKFVATNSANVSNYSVYIRNMNFTVSSSGASISATSALKVYKDSVQTANQLATTNYTYTANKGMADPEFADTSIGQDGASARYIGSTDFTELEIAAGSSRTIVVTLATTNSGLSTNETYSLGIARTANNAHLPGILWSDSSSYAYEYYTVDTLPLSGKTLVF